MPATPPPTGPEAIPWALLLLLSAAGAFVLYLLNRNAGRQPFSLFQVLNIDISRETGKPHTILFDMIVSSLIGGGIVFALVHPESTGQAIVAGLGMTGLLSAYAKEG